MRVHVKGGMVFRFDGFPRDGYDRMKDFCKENYGLQLELREQNVKGWNWGDCETKGEHEDRRMGLRLGENGSGRWVESRRTRNTREDRIR